MIINSSGIGKAGIGSKGITLSIDNPILSAEPTLYFAPRLSTVTYGTGAKVANYENLGTLGDTYDLAQATEVNQPSVLSAQVNNLDMIQYVAGTNMSLKNAVSSTNLVDSDRKSFTCYVVFKQDTNGSSGSHIHEWITSGGIDAFKLALYNLGTRTLIQCGNSTANQGRIISNSKPADRDTKYYITVIRRNGDTIECKWYNNGLKLTMVETVMTGVLPVQTRNFIQDPIGIIGDYAIFNKYIDDTTNSAIIEYLEKTYGFK
jgi:hypothetical protein